MLLLFERVTRSWHGLKTRGVNWLARKLADAVVAVVQLLKGNANLFKFVFNLLNREQRGRALTDLTAAVAEAFFDFTLFGVEIARFTHVLAECNKSFSFTNERLTNLFFIHAEDPSQPTRLRAMVDRRKLAWKSSSHPAEQAEQRLRCGGLSLSFRR